MQKHITTCLTYKDQAEEAVRFYASLIPNSSVGSIARYGKNAPMPEGMVMTVAFQLNGQDYLAINAGEDFHFTYAVSLMVHCDDQAEIDRLWDGLTADGGKPGPCGWLTDRYGVAWQIVPAQLAKWMSGDPERMNRVLQEVMKMGKLDIATLQRAYDGV